MNSNFLKLFLLGLLIECAKSESINLLENAIFISWTNKGFSTSFYASANIGNGVSVGNAWLSIGLNTQSTMVFLKLIQFFFLIKYVFNKEWCFGFDL